MKEGLTGVGETKPGGLPRRSSELSLGERTCGGSLQAQGKMSACPPLALLPITADLQSLAQCLGQIHFVEKMNLSVSTLKLAPSPWQHLL